MIAGGKRNMKKLLALILAVVCVFSLFSCGNDALDNFAKAMNNTDPVIVKLTVKAATAYGDLTNSYVTTYNEDGSFKVEYTAEKFAAIDEGDADAKLVESGTVTCDKDGNYSDGGELSGKLEATSGSKLSLKAKKMDETVSPDGNVLTAKVEAKNTKAVFGVEFASDVTLVMTKSSDKIVSYTMTYALEAGEVIVTCEYVSATPIEPK